MIHPSISSNLGMFLCESELIALNIICMIRILCVPKLSEESFSLKLIETNFVYDGIIIIIIKMVQHGIN